MGKTDLETLVNLSVLSQKEIDLKPIIKKASEYEGNKIQNKNMILKYLKSFKVAWFTSQSVRDMIEDYKINKADNLYNDGWYEWSESEIYHFEKYNMPLDEEFIKHVMVQFGVE